MKSLKRQVAELIWPNVFEPCRYGGIIKALNNKSREVALQRAAEIIQLVRTHDQKEKTDGESSR
jgi:hypothetical protein